MPAFPLPKPTAIESRSAFTQTNVMTILQKNKNMLFESERGRESLMVPVKIGFSYIWQLGSISGVDYSQENVKLSSG